MLVAYLVACHLTNKVPSVIMGVSLQYRQNQKTQLYGGEGCQRRTSDMYLQSLEMYHFQTAQIIKGCSAVLFKVNAYT